ncbi:MAG: transglycosylase domain-containing protein [Myxococcales bacterium]
MASALGAAAAAAVTGVVSPLSLCGDKGHRAAALFNEDLAQYRAAPPDVRASALVSAAAAGYEDRSVFTRPRWVPPISPTGFARALVRNLRGIPEGGSTIPQQLAKLYLREGRRGTVADKLGEAWFATWLVRQAAPDEVVGLYLNSSAAATLGGPRRPADGLGRLSLALFGLPLRRLSREDQLVLGAAPRGVPWLRAHPALSARRLASAREWLVAEGLWDASVRSYLDDGLDSSSAFGFVDGWTERVASGASAAADLDLVSAIDRFRDGLSEALWREFPGTGVRAAFAALGSGGAVLARSGAESALMAVNYGSIAKLEALDLAVEAFGPRTVHERMLPPGGCVRWIWATKSQRGTSPASYCPADVTPSARAMSFDEAVARSINSMTVRHALLLPPLLAQWRPDLLQEMSTEVPACERAALDSPADRALASGLLAQIGETLRPDQVAPELSYSAAGVALFRHLRARRELAGLPAERLPDDPTSLLGNSSRATAEQIGGYLHRKLVAGDGSCGLSDTGALLALHRRVGTLRWLAWRWPKLVFAGKTGSSPHDDSAVAGIAVCLDERPVVLVAALRPLQAPLPDGLHGSVLLRGLDSYLRELRRLDRRVTPLALPAWAEAIDTPAAVPETISAAATPAQKEER